MRHNFGGKIFAVFLLINVPSDKNTLLTTLPPTFLSLSTFFLGGKKWPKSTMTGFRLLNHCMLVDFSTVISWMSPFLILGVSGLFQNLFFVFGEKSYAASDLGLHYLHIPFYGFPGKKGLNLQNFYLLAKFCHL